MKRAKKSNKSKKQVTQKTAKQPVAATDKLCPKCGKTLPLNNFPHDARRKDGLYIYCRVCEAARQYDKHTRNMVRKAEAEGYVVLKINHVKPVLQIDVLKIDSNPLTGRTTETELVTPLDRT